MSDHLDDRHILMLNLSLSVCQRAIYNDNLDIILSVTPCPYLCSVLVISKKSLPLSLPKLSQTLNIINTVST